MDLNGYDNETTSSTVNRYNGIDGADGTDGAGWADRTDGTGGTGGTGGTDDNKNMTAYKCIRKIMAAGMMDAIKVRVYTDRDYMEIDYVQLAEHEELCRVFCPENFEREF